MSDDDFIIEIEPTTETTEIDDKWFDLGFNGDMPEQPEEPKEVEVAAEPPKPDLRLEFVNGLAEQHGMDPETYIQAVQEAHQQEEVYELMRQGVNEKLAIEILETRKEKAKFESEKQAQLQQQAQQENKMLTDFLEYFEQSTGRPWDGTKDEIPQQAWEAVKSGKPLKEAFKTHSLEDAFLTGFNSSM